MALFTPTPNPTDVCPPCKFYNHYGNVLTWILSLYFHDPGSLSAWMGLMIRPDNKATASVHRSHTLIPRPYPPPFLTVLQCCKCEVGCPKNTLLNSWRPSLGYFNWINDCPSHDQPTWNQEAEEEAKECHHTNLWIANGLWMQWLTHFNSFSYLQLPLATFSYLQLPSATLATFSYL